MFYKRVMKSITTWMSLLPYQKIKIKYGKRQFKNNTIAFAFVSLTPKLLFKLLKNNLLQIILSCIN